MSSSSDSFPNGKKTNGSDVVSYRKRIYKRKPAIRVNFRYNTTVIRVAEDDKEIFDRQHRKFQEAVDERFSHHEFFAVIIRESGERLPEIIARYKRDPLPLSDERALAAALERIAESGSLDEEGSMP